MPPEQIDNAVDPDLVDATVQAALATAPVGLALLDGNGRFRRVNRTLAAIYRRSESECVGRAPADILEPDDAAAHEDALRQVRAGTPLVHSDHLLLGMPGSAFQNERHWAMSWFPVPVPGHGGDAVAMITIDLSARNPVELALRRSEERHRSLLHASNQMVWAADPTGSVHEDCPEWRRVTGQSVEQFLGHGWLDALHPDDRDSVRDAWRDAVDDAVEFQATFRVRGHHGEYRHYHTRAVPLCRDDRLVEWVGVHTDATTQREVAEMRYRLTQQLSEAALRTVRLQKATADLAEALTVEQVVGAITEICHAEVGADRVDVALLDHDRVLLRPLRPLAAEETPAVPATGVAVDTADVMTIAVRERKPCVASNPNELRALLRESDTSEEFPRGTGEKAWIGLPLLSAGSAVGALRLAFQQPRGVSDEERVFLEALAVQCTLALQRAEMFEREHRTAEALQQSLLPEQLPTMHGVRLASLYRSGSKHVQVGGDWYDAFSLPEGRIGAVLGDVMGKGIEAATGMSRVRNALRALAFTTPEPADVLSGLDRMFLATERDEQVTTLVYTVLHPGTGEGLLGSAGHLPPLLVGPDTEPVLLETDPGTPLGLPWKRAHHTFLVPPGNTVVLYSDGLVENRKRGLVTGLAELATVASHATAEVMRDPDTLLAYLVEHMLAGYEQDDDVTLFAVHVPEHHPG